MGFFALPADGAGVWIEFEHGDPDFPIWTGCWWGSAADLPNEVLTRPQSNKILLRTAGGSSFLIDDTPGMGGISLTTSSGQKIRRLGRRDRARQRVRRQHQSPGPAGVDQRRRGEADMMPGYLLDAGATALCAHGGRFRASERVPE